ncbi:MAG: ATP synthase subunit I [Acidobacteriia bacterium]|nr:ATP synthase subunit I [Terriglobia bacterium]
MNPEEDVYRHAVRRIDKIAVALTIAGLVAAFVAGGWKWAAGFAVGAAASWLNFRWLKQLVGALGSERRGSGLAVFVPLRYLLLGGAGYVIVKYSLINVRAALAGFLVLTAAVMIEALIEIIYARN